MEQNPNNQNQPIEKKCPMCGRGYPKNSDFVKNAMLF